MGTIYIYYIFVLYIYFTTFTTPKKGTKKMNENNHSLAWNVIRYVAKQNSKLKIALALSLLINIILNCIIIMR